MNDSDEELRQAVALFRYGLIADVLRLAPGSPDIRRTLHHKAQRTYTIPGTRRTRVAVETMRDWLSLYRTGGFEALYPKSRADRGLPRRLPPEVAELLVALKTEHPALSVKALIGAARERGVDHPLAPSTVHRLLSREGLLDKRPGEPVATDRRRFAFRDAGELWMSDVMHGPKVTDGRRRRKTFLIAFIDDATRVLPFPDVNAPMQPSDSLVPFGRRSGLPSPTAYLGAQVLFFAATPVPTPTRATSETLLPRLPVSRLSPKEKRGYPRCLGHPLRACRGPRPRRVQPPLARSRCGHRRLQVK